MGINTSRDRRNDIRKIRVEEVEKFFREIGLEKEEDRNRFKFLESKKPTDLDYEIRFSNNTSTKNG